MEVNLLDCTLRDGGFVNDWDFGNSVILNIFKRLVKSNTEYIEIGFLDGRVKKNLDKTIMPDTETLNEIFNKENKGNATILAMVDYGTCDIENIDNCLDTFIDGIRVIFKKKDIDNALSFCEKLKDKGYKIFAQPVSITSYSSEELKDLVNKINKLQPHAMSIVDTYGLLHKDNLFSYFRVINDNLDDSIGVGYHSHNNYQLSYSNCIELLNESKNSNKNIVLDSSLYGIGKSAGNTNTELLASYLNNFYNKKYDIDQILEAIEVDIMNIFLNHPWGYSMPYYLSAINDCHPSYVKYLINKKSLSIKDVNIILKRIDDTKKLSFDQALIEKIYEEYQTKEKDDSRSYDELVKELENSNLMILGPGNSLIENKDQIIKLQEQENLIVLSTNFIISEIKIDYLFMSNAKRYSNIRETILSFKQNMPFLKIIGTSNINQIGNDFDYVLNYARLLNGSSNIDNSLIMLLYFLKSIGIQKIYLCGFDGFSSDTNYFDSSFDFDINKIQFEQINNAISQKLLDLTIDDDFELSFITNSKYDEAIKLSRRKDE